MRNKGAHCAGGKGRDRLGEAAFTLASRRGAVCVLHQEEGSASTMRIERRAIGLTTAALLFAVAAGCADSDDNADPTSSPTVTPSPTSPTSASPTAPTSTPPSDSQVASDAAASVVRRYYTVLDDLGQNPGTPLRNLSSVATGAQRSTMSRVLRSQRNQGERQVGRAKVAELKVQAVDLDNSDPSAGKVPLVTVDVCVDVHAVDILDRSGKSVVSPTRPNSGWTRYTVVNFDYAKNPTADWRIENGQDLKKAPCVP